MPTWDVDLYLRFATERTQPLIDLLARIALEKPARVLDIGCGPGNSTEMLRRRWPDAHVTGLDNSATMLDRARDLHPDWPWIQADVGTWQPPSGGQFDLVFSNGALQWVPHHAELFPRLLAMVASGGALAVQMPTNFHSPAWTVLAEIGNDPHWHGVFEGITLAAVESLTFYYDLLSRSAAKLELWTTEYLYVMPGAAAIVEWLRGTGMRPYLDALPHPAERKRFEKECLAGFAKAYPRQADGNVLFPFKRMFIVAYR